MNSKNAEIELKHIQIELENNRTQHMRHFIDQYYCYKNNFVNSNGKACWDKLLWKGYVSVNAQNETDRKKVVKEHVVPLKVIVSKLKELSESNQTSLEAIERCINKYLIFATVTKSEDELLRKAKLSSTMPFGFYDEGHELYEDNFARYKIAGIDLVQT